MESETSNGLSELVAKVVCSYVSNNSVVATDLPSIIQEVYVAFEKQEEEKETVIALKPAVPIKKSITPDYLICLEDGRKFKTLKRHLRTQYKLSPEAYRERWGLSPDYPMVAPRYASARSQLAREMRLGKRRS